MTNPQRAHSPHTGARGTLLHVGVRFIMDIIEIARLSKHYGQRVGVDELSLTIPEGALFGFLGPNGSGKSTTIRVLMGFLNPTSGQARMLGGDCWRDSARLKAEVGYLPGDLRPYPWLTARLALDLWSRIRGRNVHAHGEELAHDFELPLETAVGRMSRGMKQKLGLILALAHQPRLLILDEPTSGLDPLIQDRLFQKLRAYAARGATVFFSSHTLSEVEDLCDRVAILREGRLVADAPMRQFVERARRRFTIAWNDGSGARLDIPPFLTLDDRQADQWAGWLVAPAPHFLAWCADKPIADFTLGSPDLRSVFRAYYGAAENRR